ncbi:MAG: hypothetical protein Nk1A_7780 [Endomicrobiia bacterium]|nr:MAG: hypothetical protein Nk1A_7780 [Endomicrobiia bacterium]
MAEQYMYINKLIQNKDSIDKAITRADSNDGLGEIALTTTG